MYKARYFGNRYQNAYYFNGGLPISDEKEYFSSGYSRAGYFRQAFFSKAHEGVVEVLPVVTSIAIELLPNTVDRGDPVVIVAYVYDQFGKPMQGVRVNFNSSNSAILPTPSFGFTDSLGRVVKTVVVGLSGTCSMYAEANLYTVFTNVTVSAVSGGTTSTLTHGATIQPGNAGGGSPGPIRVKLTRQIRRWPTR